jgi:PTH1 family peptidyl-tRNA hydrolase
MEETSIQFVVGLGNPGRRYERTRHNLGFLLLEGLAKRWNAPPPRQMFQGLLSDARYGGHRVMLLAPQMFMNRSGQSVAEAVRFYKAELSDVLVVLDDLALPPGQIRLRAGGSAGGHNGLADVVRALGSIEVPRLRMGIGPTPPYMDGADYVLGVMSEDELALANQAVEKACEAVEAWLNNGLDDAMNRYNRTE